VEGSRRLLEAEDATVNGAPGLVLRDADGVLTVISFTVDGGRITALDVVRNPDKLSGARDPG
jgi:RNA polymerase sigma-70 factor, ECF subfamily